MSTILKFILSVDFLYWLFSFVCCVLLFVAMYDHCVYKRPFGESLKNRTLQLLLSPLLINVIVTVLVMAIVYIIYTLIF